MSRVERLLYVVIIVVLVFSAPASPGAEAAPQKATKLKILTIHPSQFISMTSVQCHFTGHGTNVCGSTGQGGFIGQLNVPNGARVRWVKMVVLDFNPAEDKNTCLFVEYRDIVSSGTKKDLGKVCSKGSSNIARQIIKLPLFGQKITRLNTLSAAIYIPTDNVFYGIRVGYVK